MLRISPEIILQNRQSESNLDLLRIKPSFQLLR